MASSIGEDAPMKTSLEIAQEAVATADRADRGAGRTRARRDRAVRPLQGEGLAVRARPAQGPTGRQGRVRHGHDADPGRRGQDDHAGRAHPGARRDRQEPGGVPARGVARSGVRHQGRRGRRRPHPGRPDGGPEPALHRRHPRDRRRQQPARGDDRRLDPARQPAPDRRAADPVAARGRHERPRAARHRGRPRRPRQRLSARDRLRHHRGVRGDGDHGGVAGPPGPAPASGPHHRGVLVRRRQGDHRRGPAARPAR